MKLVFVLGIIISVTLLLSLFYFQNYQAEPKIDSSLFSWESFTKDAKYSWDGQELLKKKFSPYQHLPLNYNGVTEESHFGIALNILDAAIGMYMITGDQQYLNEASSSVEKLASISEEKIVPS